MGGVVFSIISFIYIYYTSGKEGINIDNFVMYVLFWGLFVLLMILSLLAVDETRKTTSCLCIRLGSFLRV